MINNLYGDELAKKIKQELEQKCALIKPKLAVILTKDDFGSEQYTKQIERNALSLGVEMQLHSFAKDAKEKDLVEKIKELNLNDEVDGIIIQLPLPDEIDKQKAIESVDPKKDIDGLHPYNLGRLYAGLPSIIPCTAKAIMRLLKHYNYSVSGKVVAVIGRSLSVGKPISALMTNDNATVVLCHSKTADLFKITQKADIIITAIGKAEFFDESYFNENSIVIDVGINNTSDGICGDVNYNRVADKVKAITPVPKGVGSLTIAMLMENLLEVSSKRRR